MIAWPLDGKTYTAEPIGAFCCTRTRGVYSAEDCFAVRADSGRRITLTEGIAWLHADKYWGIVCFQKEAQTFEIPVGSGSLGRYYAVAIQYDKTKNEVAAVLKAGETATEPQKPVPVRDAYYDEIIVATILQRPGAVEITSADIVDERLNEEMCGIMRDGVTSIPSEMLYEYFMERFNGLYSMMDDLVHGKLPTPEQIGAQPAGNYATKEELETALGGEWELLKTLDIKGERPITETNWNLNAIAFNTEMGAYSGDMPYFRIMDKLGQEIQSIGAGKSSMHRICFMEPDHGRWVCKYTEDTAVAYASGPLQLAGGFNSLFEKRVSSNIAGFTVTGLPTGTKVKVWGIRV